LSGEEKGACLGALTQGVGEWVTAQKKSPGMKAEADDRDDRSKV